LGMTYRLWVGSLPRVAFLGRVLYHVRSIAHNTIAGAGF
jgi:hypothetical protein